MHYIDYYATDTEGRTTLWCDYGPTETSVLNSAVQRMTAGNHRDSFHARIIGIYCGPFECFSALRSYDNLMYDDDMIVRYNMLVPVLVEHVLSPDSNVSDAELSVCDSISHLYSEHELVLHRLAKQHMSGRLMDEHIMSMCITAIRRAQCLIDVRAHSLGEIVEAL